VAQFAGDDQARGGEFDDSIPAVELDVDPAADGDALQFFQEIGMEKGAAELAVCDAVQAKRFLLLDRRLDRAVFRFTQRLSRDFALEEPVAGCQQFLRSEQAADVIGSKGGI
jgi:hypothetical protein